MEEKTSGLEGHRNTGKEVRKVKKLKKRGYHSKYANLPYEERLRMYEQKKQAVYMDPTLSARAREIELKNLIAKYDI